MRTVVGDRPQKQIRRLISIVDMLRQVIVDGTGAIERVLKPINDALRQPLQIRRKCNVRTVLGRVLGPRRVHARMRRKRTPIDVTVSSIDAIAIGHRE